MQKQFELPKRYKQISRKVFPNELAKLEKTGTVLSPFIA